jgi:hypothetical protein
MINKSMHASTSEFISAKRHKEVPSRPLFKEKSNAAYKTSPGTTDF